jgi:CelD/BcsL family acetyltransferase involved in cellulose biosynthesis
MPQVDVLTDIEAVEKLIPEWEQLSAGLHPWTPFTTPAWLMTWWKYFRRDTIFSRDELRFYTVRNDAGVLIGLCPMMLTYRPGKGPFRTRELQFLGADPYITELRGPICAQENATAVAEAFLTHFHASPSSDWIQCQGFPDPVTLENRFGFIADERLDSVDHYLTLPQTWENLKKSLPRNIKESIRKCYNSLAREGHSFEFRVIQNPEDIDHALDTFFDLHARRADLSGTIQHRNVFASPSALAFLRTYCASSAQQGSVAIFQLSIDGKIIATRIGFLGGDEIYLYFSGYDPKWRRHSVMTTTLVEIIKWAISAQLRICNLSSGTDVSKTRWRPEHVRSYGGFVATNSFAGRLILPTARTLRHRRITFAIPEFLQKRNMPQLHTHLKNPS